MLSPLVTWAQFGMHFLLIYSPGVPLFYCLLYVILRAVYSNDRYVSRSFQLSVYVSLCQQTHHGK